MKNSKYLLLVLVALAAVWSFFTGDTNTGMTIASGGFIVAMQPGTQAMTLINSTDYLEALYRRILAKMAGNGATEDEQATVQPFTIRMHQKLSASKNAYPFKFGSKANSGDELSEVLPANDDTFILGGISILVSDVPLIGDEYKFGNARYHTFPDPTVFDGALGAFELQEADTMLSIFGGTYDLKSNGNPVLEDQLSVKHLFFESGNAPFRTEDGLPFVPVRKNAVFNMNQVHELNLKLNGYIANVNDGGNNHVAIFLHGYRVRLDSSPFL